MIFLQFLNKKCHLSDNVREKASIMSSFHHFKCRMPFFLFYICSKYFNYLLVISGSLTFIQAYKQMSQLVNSSYNPLYSSEGLKAQSKIIQMKWIIDSDLTIVLFEKLLITEKVTSILFTLPVLLIVEVDQD